MKYACPVHTVKNFTIEYKVVVYQELLERIFVLYQPLQWPALRPFLKDWSFKMMAGGPALESDWD